MISYLERKFKELVRRGNNTIHVCLDRVWDLLKLRDYCMRTFPDGVYHAYCCPGYVRLEIVFCSEIPAQTFMVYPTQSINPLDADTSTVMRIAPNGNMSLDMENPPSEADTGDSSGLVLPPEWDHLSIRNACLRLFPEYTYKVYKYGEHFMLKMVEDDMYPGTFVLFPNSDNRQIIMRANHQILIP